MAGRKKKETMDKGVEARRRARRLGIAPSGTRVIPDKRNKPEKHKKDLLQESDPDRT